MQTSFPSDHTFHGFAWTTLPNKAWQWSEKLATICSLTISSVLLFCHVKPKIFPPMSPGRYQVTLVKRAQHYWFSHPALPLQSQFVPSLSIASLLGCVMTQVHLPSHLLTDSTQTLITPNSPLWHISYPGPSTYYFSDSSLVLLGKSQSSCPLNFPAESSCFLHQCQFLQVCRRAFPTFLWPSFISTSAALQKSYSSAAYLVHHSPHPSGSGFPACCWHPWFQPNPFQWNPLLPP